jgi:hypothetical protein
MINPTTTCQKTLRLGLASALLVILGWTLLLIGDSISELIPAWLSWQFGFMILLPIGALGLLYAVARVMTLRTCF